MVPYSCYSCGIKCLIPQHDIDNHLQAGIRTYIHSTLYIGQYPHLYTYIHTYIHIYRSLHIYICRYVLKICKYNKLRSYIEPFGAGAARQRGSLGQVFQLHRGGDEAAGGLDTLGRGSRKIQKNIIVTHASYTLHPPVYLYEGLYMVSMRWYLGCLEGWLGGAGLGIKSFL